MSNWNKMDRFSAIFSGEKADRPMISGWRHFIDKEQTAEDLAEITISFTKKFDWDWVKINPRAVYYAEAWGNEYDFNDYRTVFPKLIHNRIKEAKDVWEIEKIKAAGSPPFAEQLEAVEKIRKGLPDTPLLQTVFSPLTVLLFLMGQSGVINEDVYGMKRPLSVKELFSEERSGVHHALHAVALTLADYVEELFKKGVDGIFYAVTGTAHPQLFTEAAFNEFSRPYDLIVLEAAKNGKNILHTCNVHSQADRFNDYPINGISWDTEAHGNPGLNGNLTHTKVGGVDHKLFGKNDLDSIRAQAAKALKIMKDQPFSLAPNCSIPITVGDEALRIFRETINEGENA